MANDTYEILSEMTRLPLPNPGFIHSESSSYYFNQIRKIIRSQHSDKDCQLIHENSHSQWLKHGSTLDNVAVFNYINEIKEILIKKNNETHDNKTCYQMHGDISHLQWLFNKEKNQYDEIYQRTIQENGIIPHRDVVENIEDKYEWEYGQNDNCYILSIFKYINLSYQLTNVSQQVKSKYKLGDSFWIRYFTYYIIQKIKTEIYSKNERTLIIASPNSEKIPFYKQLNNPNERVCQMLSSHFNQFEYIPCHLQKIESHKRPYPGRSKEENKREYYLNLIKKTKLTLDDPIINPDNLILFDDVYTTGITFRAHRDIIRSRYNILLDEEDQHNKLFSDEPITIYGLNISRTQ